MLTGWNILFYVCDCMMPDGSTNTEKKIGFYGYYAQHKATTQLERKHMVWQYWLGQYVNTVSP